MSQLAGVFTDHTFKDVVLPETVVERGEYERVRFENCTFTASRFVGCHFDEVVFANCECPDLDAMFGSAEPAKGGFSTVAPKRTRR